MHISGGTTEIFTVGSNLEIGLIGGCADLHAGQLVDRVGVSLGMAFPSGKHMEVLASERSGEPAVRLPYGFAARNAHFGHRKRGAKIDRAGH